jgi:hypothetical protein
MAAEAFALLGDPASARSYADSAAQVAAMFASSAWQAMAEWAAGSLAAAEHDEERAQRHYGRARELYRQAGQPYWAGRSLKLGSLAPA